jgi:Flp pilus assembly protein CpaB
VRRSWPRSSRAYLAGAVAASVAAALGLHAYMVGVARAAGTPGPEATVVMAARAIGRGQPIPAASLRLASLPRAYAPPGSLTRIGQASGRVALADLAPGEVVTQTRLARVRAGPVASLIPEGLRAFAVPTSLPTGAVVPGDHVDVLATFNAGQPHTETVVSGVEVLFVLGGRAAGSGSPSSDIGLDPAAGSGASTTLLLLISPEQERSLAYARAFANLEVTVAPVSAEPDG